MCPHAKFSHKIDNFLILQYIRYKKIRRIFIDGTNEILQDTVVSEGLQDVLAINSTVHSLIWVSETNTPKQKFDTRQLKKRRK